MDKFGDPLRDKEYLTGELFEFLRYLGIKAASDAYIELYQL
jgi:hypothetical protein